MATRNYIKAKKKGWLGLVDNDEQVYVTAEDLILIKGGQGTGNQAYKTRKITLGNMCAFRVPEKT